MKILYVEDNDDNVYMLKNRLSRAGFTVVVATDGAQGVAMAASEQPDLILMDLTLPDIAGKRLPGESKLTQLRSKFRLLRSRRMRWLAIGKRRSLRDAMTLTPNRWRCLACSKRLKR